MLIKLLILLFSFASFGQSVEELNRKLDILAEEVETLKLGKISPNSTEFFGLGQSASKVYAAESGTTIGGYGEIVFNKIEGKAGQGEVLRKILYVGHKFSPKWVLNTEIEFEHVDEVFVEFAFIDYLQSEKLNLRAGLLLTPMGFVNELHEPIYFNSVKRPEVEKSIIPSTWRELGFGAFGKIGNLTYKQYIINGLNAEGFSEKGLRSGRKKGGVDENASTISSVTRLDYEVNPHLTLGGAAYIGASSATTSGVPAVDTQMYQGHFNFNYKNFFIKGLYVLANLSDVEDFNAATSRNVAEQMNGFYSDIGYGINFGESVVTPFFRYEKYNTHAKVTTGNIKDPEQDKQNLVFGVSYRPIDKIILKADYALKTNEANTGSNEFNFGLGYLF